MYYSWMGLCSGHEHSVVIRELSLYPQSLLAKLTVQSTLLITTLGGASKRCPYSRSVGIPEVSLYSSGMGLCSGHGNSVVVRELSLYSQSLLAKLTVNPPIKYCDRPLGHTPLYY